jgi:hypothetical protein
MKNYNYILLSPFKRARVKVDLMNRSASKSLVKEKKKLITSHLNDKDQTSERTPRGHLNKLVNARHEKKKYKLHLFVQNDF